MLRFVALVTLVVAVHAGAPIGYGVPAYQYAAPARAVAVHSAYQPIHQVHAPPTYQQVQAAPAYRPVLAPAYQTAPIHAVHAPLQVAVAKPIHQEPFDHHPSYNFGYAVHDSITGDHHSHSESRDGDVVKGQYSLVEPDGSIRTVTYTADAVNGFNAVVDRQSPAKAIAVAPTVVKQPFAVQVAPSIHSVHASPLVHHTPQFQAIHAPSHQGQIHAVNTATPLNQIHAVHAQHGYHY